MEDTTTVVATTLEVEAVEPTVAAEAAAEVVVEAVEAAVAAAVAEAAVVVVAVAAEIYPNNCFYISDSRSISRFKNKNSLYDLD